jgi:Protein of unknown function (DUF2958)
VRGRLDLPGERDRHFWADRPLSAYAEAAQTEQPQKVQSGACGFSRAAKPSYQLMETNLDGATPTKRFKRPRTAQPAVWR